MWLPEPDRARLGETLETLGAIGYIPGGGVTRFSLGPEDAEARRYVIGLLEAAGMSLRVDPVGNLIARRAGADDSLPPVATGSHIDTVPQGGKYDGAVGVLAAIEAINLLNEGGVRTRHPLEVIVFTGEEHGGFGTGTKGSRAMAGKTTPGQLLAWRNPEGTTFAEALRAAGYRPDLLAEAARPPGSLKCFVEVHIEQGRVLEEEGHRVGVVTAIAGLTQQRVRLRGRADHSGATPMGLRRDALAGAAELVLAVERLAQAEAALGTVATVGELRVKPGSTVIVPGEVEMSIDARGVDDESKRRVLAGIDEALEDVCRRRGLEWERSFTVDEGALPLSPSIIDHLAAACQMAEVEPRLLPSGANHDARHMAVLGDAGMLFVPSVGGVSHSPDEYTSLADVCLGARVLAYALVRLAGEA